jgi:hypothetical protein
VRAHALTSLTTMRPAHEGGGAPESETSSPVDARCPAWRAPGLRDRLALQPRADYPIPAVDRTNYPCARRRVAAGRVVAAWRAIAAAARSRVRHRLLPAAASSPRAGNGTPVSRRASQPAAAATDDRLPVRSTDRPPSRSTAQLPQPALVSATCQDPAGSPSSAGRSTTRPETTGATTSTPATSTAAGAAAGSASRADVAWTLSCSMRRRPSSRPSAGGCRRPGRRRCQPAWGRPGLRLCPARTLAARRPVRPARDRGGAADCWCRTGQGACQGDARRAVDVARGQNLAVVQQGDDLAAGGQNHRLWPRSGCRLSRVIQPVRRRPLSPSPSRTGISRPRSEAGRTRGSRRPPQAGGAGSCCPGRSACRR